MGAASITISYAMAGVAHSHLGFDSSIISGRPQILAGTGLISGSGSDTYTTGGIAFDITAKMPVPVFILVTPFVGLVPEYDYSGKLLKLFFCDYDGSADGVLIQYTSGGALAASTFRWIAFGKLDS